MSADEVPVVSTVGTGPIPLLNALCMEPVAAIQGVKLPKLSQTDWALVALLQTCRLDNQTAPEGLLVWIEQLVAVVLGDLLPVGGVLFARAFDPVEAVLALHESNSDGGDAVTSAAVRARETRSRDLQSTEALLADNPVGWGAFTLALDVGTTTSNTTRRSLVRELDLDDSRGIRDVGEHDSRKGSTTAQFQD